MANEKLPQIAGDLFVATCDAPWDYINFGGVKTLDAVLDNDSDRVEEKVQNRAAITGASIIPMINAEILESIDVEKIGLLLGLEVETTAGTEVSDHEEILEGLKAGVRYPLEFKNSDNTEVSISSIEGPNGALTEADYNVEVNIVGETVITFNDDGNYTVVYTYTPAVSAKVSATRRYKADTTFIAKIISEKDAQGRVNVITLTWAIAKSAYTLDFADLATSGGVKGTTITFEGQRGSEIVVDLQTLDS